MSWAYVVKSLVGAADVWLGDQMADWTEDTDYKKYWEDSDNPTWSDYVGGAGRGAGGIFGLIGTAAQGIDDYNQDKENYDYRDSIGGAMSSVGYGKYNKLLRFLPDTRDQPDQSDPSSSYIADDLFSGTYTPYGNNNVPYSSIYGDQSDGTYWQDDEFDLGKMIQ